MHSLARASLTWVAFVLELAACGSKSSGGSGGGGAGGGATGKISASSCYSQCDAQQATQGCTPIVSLAECKMLCDALAGSTPASCAGAFDAYYSCSAHDGFTCAVGLVSQKTDACKAKQDAFDKCSHGGMKSTCQGQLDSGVCPSVQCPCPSGAKPVSGFDNSSGSCKCLDTVTCKDLFCD
jgi:hypothetical protein